MTIFHCKKCKQIVAKKDDTFLYFKDSMLTLRDCELAILCDCGMTFYFTYKPVRKVKKLDLCFA